MARFGKNPETGEVVVYDRSTGGWRPASQQEQIVEAQGMAGKAEAFAEGLTGAQSIAGLFSPKIAERAQALTGEVGGTAANTGSALGLAAAGVGALSPMASRVAAVKAAREGAQEASEAGFRRMPSDVVPGPLKAPTRSLESGVESLPVGRLITESLIRNPNQKNLNRLALRAIGATDDMIKQTGARVTDEIVAAADARVGGMFDEVGARISPGLDKDEVTRKALELADSNLISNAQLMEVVDASADDIGRELTSLRSSVAAAARSESDRATRIQLQNQIDELDKIIASAFDDSAESAAVKKLYSDARSYYKARMALEKGQTWTQEAINPKSLDSALRSLYKKDYRTGGVNQGAQEVQDFLAAAREAQGMNIGLPSSGTAERMLAAGLLSGAVGGATGVNLQ